MVGGIPVVPGVTVWMLGWWVFLLCPCHLDLGELPPLWGNVVGEKEPGSWACHTVTWFPLCAGASVLQPWEHWPVAAATRLHHMAGGSWILQCWHCFCSLPSSEHSVGATPWLSWRKSVICWSSLTLPSSQVTLNQCSSKSDMQNTYTSQSPEVGCLLKKFLYIIRPNNLHLKYSLPYEYPNQ